MARRRVIPRKRKFWCVERRGRRPIRDPPGNGLETFNSSGLEVKMPEANVRRLRLSWFVVALLLAVPIGILAQAGQGGAGGQRGAAPAAAAPATGRSAAPVDLTG